MNDVQSAWLAGFLDGEGSFMVRKDKKDGYDYWFSQICASSTDEVVLEYCKSLVGGKITNWVRPSKKCKPSKIWYLGNTALGPVLEKIIPHLIIKREQAEILLMFRREVRRGASPGNRGIKTCHKRNVRRESMRLATKALNHRGTSEIPQEQVAALAEVRTLLESSRLQNSDFSTS